LERTCGARISAAQAARRRRGLVQFQLWMRVESQS